MARSAKVTVSGAETSETAYIAKDQGSGLAKEYFTDADNFGIQCKDVHYPIMHKHCPILYIIYLSY